MSEHSILPPSSAARRVACPGSRAMEEYFPEDDSPEAREGHAAHWVASEALTGYWAGLGTKAPNDELVTEEMMEGAELYTNHIYSILQTKPDFIEEKIEIPTMHAECWGTPDAWHYAANRKHLYIWDYKFGHGFVEVYENWQLIEYAAGILHKLGINGHQAQFTTVSFFIVQPRSYHRDGSIREWRVKASELRPLFNTLEAAEIKAMQPETDCFPSPECHDCKARHACETLQRSTLKTIDISNKNIPMQLPPKELGHQLKYLMRAYKLLDAIITGMTEQAISEINNGNRIPGFILEESSGKQIWAASPEEIMEMAKIMGFNSGLAKSLALITPLQAISKGFDEETVKALSERTRGNKRLVPENSIKVKKLFKK